ncbi:MAG TPA: TraB/GumN family protein, partial [Casimicrobium sp.]|nr:TraB/GumN family protein [Casimicrobium sp.]
RVVNEEFGTTPEGLSARKRVFDDRHPAMADAIDSYFKQTDKHFVVIGVGHMVGENNLLEALAKKGVGIKRVE